MRLSGSYLESPALAAAYLNYFLPVNLSKIQVLLDEMPVEPARRNIFRARPWLWARDWSTRGSRLVAWARGSAALSVVAVDRSMTALHQAESLWNKYCQNSRADRHEPSDLQGRSGTDWHG